MRFFYLLLMLAVCLVSWNCAATNGEEGDSQHNTDQQQDAPLVDTKKAAEQSKPKAQPQPESPQSPQSLQPLQPSKPQTEGLSAPEGPASPEEAPPGDLAERDGKIPKNPQDPQSQPEHRSPGKPQQQQRQQQQQQQQQHAPRQGSTPTQGGNGKPLQPGEAAPPAKTPEELSQTSRNPEQATNTDDATRQEKPNAPEEVPAEKPETSTSSPTDNAVNRNATTTKDKQTDSTQTSVPSTVESAKGEFSASGTPLQNLSKAIQSSDKKDSSIRSFSLLTLAALVIFVVMAV